MGGIEANIRSRLGILDSTKLKPVFEAVLECIDEGQIYDGSRQYTQKSGHPPLIPVDSPEAQIIADAYESGFGHTQVLWPACERNGQRILHYVTNKNMHEDLTSQATWLHKERPRQQ
jgi:hypothetical protein